MLPISAFDSEHPISRQPNRFLALAAAVTVNFAQLQTQYGPAGGPAQLARLAAAALYLRREPRRT